MGFIIGVHSRQLSGNFECYHFIDRTFYNFVSSGELYGEHSILIQSGRYYGVDLSALLKIVYTWEEISDEYITANVQDAESLLQVVTAFRNRVQADPGVCDHIVYHWFARSSDKTTEAEREACEKFLRMFPDAGGGWNPETGQLLNPWKWYFEQGQVLMDLDTLIRSLKCYKSKGVTEVFLAAG
jgi:hypothetical protein